MTPIGLYLISIEFSMFVRRPFICRSLTLVVFAGTFASRLDVTRLRHSGRHAQARQYPTHQHDVGGKEGSEPDPVRHKHHLLLFRQLLYELSWPSAAMRRHQRPAPLPTDREKLVSGGGKSPVRA